jgi:hypothetical protein
MHVSASALPGCELGFGKGPSGSFQRGVLLECIVSCLSCHPPCLSCRFRLTRRLGGSAELEEQNVDVLVLLYCSCGLVSLLD